MIRTKYGRRISLARWLLCLLGSHDFKLSKYQSLGSIGPEFFCAHCGKFSEEPTP